MPIIGGFEHNVPTQARVVMSDDSIVPAVTRTAGATLNAVDGALTSLGILSPEWSGRDAPDSYFQYSATWLRWSTHCVESVSYTHLRAHETVLDLVCRLLLEKKKKKI